MFHTSLLTSASIKLLNSIFCQLTTIVLWQGQILLAACISQALFSFSQPDLVRWPGFGPSKSVGIERSAIRRWIRQTSLNKIITCIFCIISSAVCLMPISPNHWQVGGVLGSEQALAPVRSPDTFATKVSGAPKCAKHYACLFSKHGPAEERRRGTNLEASKPFLKCIKIDMALSGRLN